MTTTPDMSLAFYGVRVDNRDIYEIRPMGDCLLVRPAHIGKEREISKITFLDFDKAFNSFLNKFLIPNQLTEDDGMELLG